MRGSEYCLDGRYLGGEYLHTAQSFVQALEGHCVVLLYDFVNTGVPLRPALI